MCVWTNEILKALSWGAYSAQVEPWSSERGGVWEGTHPPVKGVRGCDPPGKWLKTSMQICAFWVLLQIKFEFVLDADRMPQSWFPWLFPDFACFHWLKKFPDFSRFSGKLVTLNLTKMCTQVYENNNIQDFKIWSWKKTVYDWMNKLFNKLWLQHANRKILLTYSMLGFI